MLDDSLELAKSLELEKSPEPEKSLEPAKRRELTKAPSQICLGLFHAKRCAHPGC